MPHALSMSSIVISSILFFVSTSFAACYLDGSAGFELPLTYDAAGHVVCPGGFHCPGFNSTDPSTYPVFCPPSPECMVRRLMGEYCSSGMGTREPTVCPAGSYCPNATEVLPCPHGHYCPTGSVTPRKCPPLSLCGDSTEQPMTLLSIVVLLILAVVFAGVVQVYRRCLRPANLADDYHMCPRASPEAVVSRDVQNNALGASTDLSLAGRTREVLAHAFARSRGTQQPLTIRFDAIQIYLANEKDKVLLHRTSGTLRPGTVTAVLGPSGAGKTVLLRTLLGHHAPNWGSSGTLTVNGDKNIDKYRPSIGFVPQRECLHTELTVYRNLLYAAGLRLPRSWSTSDCSDFIKAVLESLGLAAVVDVPIGDAESRGVSGGQRTRTSIGVELVAAPQALLLDEPTKGLDSNTALEVVQTLKRIATETNLTVAMTVNQPRREIWLELDDILIMAPGGRTVFEGPRGRVASYFQEAIGLVISPQSNPADVILDTVTARGQELADLWMAAQTTAMDETDKRRTTATAHSVVGGNKLAAEGDDGVDRGDNNSSFQRRAVSWNGASFLTQVVLAHCRYLEKQLSTLTSLYVETVLAFLLGAVLGYSQSDFSLTGRFRYPFELISPFPLTSLLPQMHMYAFMSLGLATSTAGVNVFVNDKATFAREAACGSSRIAHYVGTVTASWYRLFLVALAFAAPYHFVAKSATPFGPYYMLFVLFSWVTYAYSGIVALVADQRSAGLIAGVLSIVYACFSGFIAFPNNLKKLSFCFWAAQALQHWVYADTENVFQDASVQWGWTVDRVPLSFGVMVAMGAAYHIIGALLLIALSRQ